ncbi:MAG: hypothetical protein ABJL55_13355 [Roseibium sp.]
MNFSNKIDVSEKSAIYKQRTMAELTGKKSQIENGLQKPSASVSRGKLSLWQGVSEGQRDDRETETCGLGRIPVKDTAGTAKGEVVRGCLSLQDYAALNKAIDKALL